MENYIHENKIKIRKSQTADTRTCDFANVSKDTLRESTKQHINDVQKGMQFFINKMYRAALVHDHTKISELDMFHKDFVSGFETQDWYELHKRTERHHITVPEGIREDINLIDVLEHVADCVMAGMGRSGSVYPMNISPETLLKAVQNTADMLQSIITVVEEDDEISNR